MPEYVLERVWEYAPKRMTSCPYQGRHIMEQPKNKVCGADIHKKFLIATILSSVIWAGFKAYVRSGQRCIARLVPEIAHRHAAIEAPYSFAMPEQAYSQSRLSRRSWQARPPRFS